MTVTKNDLELALELARRSATDPRVGLFGPSSMSWRIGREGIAFLAGGAAALLQLAHPFVAQGVADHSATREDTFGRFLRTFENVYAMLFGSIDRALGSARRVHAIHESVTGVLHESVGPWAAGSRYEANDEGALLWVHATLIVNAIIAYDMIVAPLTPADKDAYYQESKRFALLFGLGEDKLPADWPAFEAYYEGMLASGAIAITRPAREMAEFLLTPPHPAIGPVWRWYTMATSAILPAKVRRDYGLKFGSLDEATFDASIAALRRAYPLLPHRLRHVPQFLEAERRLSGGASDARTHDPEGEARAKRHPMLNLLLRLRRASLRSRKT